MYDPDFDWDEVHSLLQACAEPELRESTSWQAHDAQANVVRFAADSPHVFTGCWDSASLRCWGKTGRGYALRWELQAAGFVNDFVQVGRTALVAVSAGLIPTPGESLKAYDLDALAGACAKPQSFFLHTRGCRALSLCPKVPQLASISKDALAVSQISEGSLAPDPLVVSNPHDMKEVTSLCWQGADRLCSGGTGGAVHAWDTQRGAKLWSACVSTGAWVRQIANCEFLDGRLLVCHSDGVCWLDGREGAVVGRAGEGQAYACCVLGSQHLVALGRRLVRLDMRRPVLDPVSDLEATAAGLDSCRASNGTSVLVGMKNGKVQTVDLA
ncbi:unnamed protein product [Effrenium voratum]|nr:unnamed protein product [Effrenium voratum]